SYLTGIDPSLARAAATLGARPGSQFRHIYLPLLAPGLAITFCLAFVQAFSVFPSAVLLGAPAGPTRVISIAAYQAAFEDYDYSMASAIAIIMAGAQLLVVVLVLAGRLLFCRGSIGGAKGYPAQNLGDKKDENRICNFRRPASSENFRQRAGMAGDRLFCSQRCRP